MRRFTVIAAAVAVLTLGATSHAYAATAQVSPDGVLTYTADAGTSSVACTGSAPSATCTISATSSTTVIAALPPACTSVDSNTVRCTGVARRNVTGSSGNDILTLSGSIGGTINGGSGTDQIFVAGATGADIVDGGAGSDSVSYAGRTAGMSLTLDNGAADDGTGCPGTACERDELKGAESVTGGEGPDTMTVSGTTGEYLTGGGGDDTLTGGPGYAGLVGGDGGDVLNGGGGGGFLSGNDGDDLLLGGAGGEFLRGGTGSNVVSGGGGRDTLSWFESTGPTGGPGMVVTLGVSATGLGEHSLLADDIEDLVGSRGNDVLVGNAGPNNISGEEGGDLMDGGSVDGGPDAGDVFHGTNSGNTDIYIDTVTYASRTTPVKVTMGGFPDDGGTLADGRSEGDDLRYPGIEGLVGGSADDKLSGWAGYTVVGGRGRDELNGGPLGGTIEARDAEADTITCHPDKDVVRADTIDAVESDCKTVTRSEPPALTIEDTSVAEDGGTATFTVRASITSTETIRARYATGDGSAQAGLDYAERSGEVEIAPGATEATVSVPVEADALDEPDETFTVALSQPEYAVIADGEATATITDDDDAPALSIADATAGEAAGAVDLDVTLSAASGRSVSVELSTADGTAIAGEDYEGLSSHVVTFAPGETERSVPVTLHDDSVDGPDVTFAATLADAADATISDGEATVTITDDDEPPPVTISITDTSVTEGDRGVVSATFAVGLSRPAATDVAVDFATADGTARDGRDYTSTTGRLVIPAGQTGATIVVPVLSDRKSEPDETFTVTLSAPFGAELAPDRDRATGTIVDDDRRL